MSAATAAVAAAAADAQQPGQRLNAHSMNGSLGISLKLHPSLLASGY
jgi:hypothetical protein